MTDLHVDSIIQSLPAARKDLRECQVRRFLLHFAMEIWAGMKALRARRLSAASISLACGSSAIAPLTSPPSPACALASPFESASRSA